MATRMCGHCGGTGRVEVTGIYAETLKLLRKVDGEITGADLCKKAKCQATAMNNRLAMLERMGLAKSHWFGRKRLYRALPTRHFEIGSEYA